MKVALGMIVKNEMEFLQRHFHLLSPYFDGVIAADGDSSDATKGFLLEHHATVIPQTNPNEEAQGEHRSSVVREAEAQGFDWLLMLDADEVMFPEHIAEAIRFMEEPDNEFLAFPRIEFYGDVMHYRQNLYPDLQGRAIRLGLGYHWRNPIHELVYKGEEGASAFEMKHMTLVPTAQIFHVGWALAPARRYLRYENRERVIRGEKLLADDGLHIPDLTKVEGLKKWQGEVPW